MAAHPSSDNHIEAKRRKIIQRLNSAAGPDSICVQSGESAVGKYTTDSQGQLTYRAGVKEVTGDKAQRYLSTDIQSGRTLRPARGNLHD